MREAEIEGKRAAVAAGERVCVIEGCPLRATHLVRCELPEYGASFWLAVCGYHCYTEAPEGYNLRAVYVQQVQDAGGAGEHEALPLG